MGKQVVHEIGCAWSTDDGAPPGPGCSHARWTEAFAQDRDRLEPEDQGLPGRPPARRTANPSVTQTCRLPDGTTRVRHAGLFGQTWLTCEVAAGRRD